VAISVLYVKGERPGEDEFITSVSGPRVTLPAFSFTGGAMTLGLRMNGDFFVDVGFPWLERSGARQWDRALGAIVGVFQGSGGFYVRSRHLRVPAGELLAVSGGYAVQFGLGASYGGGMFTVWATVGVYFILEGDVVLQKGHGMVGLRLSGAAGILGRAAGELNWWIISVRVEITISAEARLTITWGVVPELALPGASGTLPAVAGAERMRLTAEFIVYARASARACIGRGWFKICKSISVTLPLRFAYSTTV
jgi:hypothetical protein